MPPDVPQTLREGRARYFEANGLPADGGYQDAWVVIRVRGIPVFAFPNTESRRRDVPLHDLHHVVTGYATDLTGEAEIGAWELASGCADQPAARVLNCQVMGTMLLFRPRRIFQAFVRGCHSRNFYGGPCDDALLERPVEKARQELGLDTAPGPASPEDRRAFARWTARALAGSWGPLIPLGLLAAWLWGPWG